jgi:hypothetical protein
VAFLVGVCGLKSREAEDTQKDFRSVAIDSIVGIHALGELLPILSQFDYSTCGKWRINRQSVHSGQELQRMT